MKKKSVNYTTHDLDENWQLLANAICLQAIHDFEYLISDRPIPGKVSETVCNIPEIRLFARTQIYSNLNLIDIMKKIERTYLKEFRPFVAEHAEEIETNWITTNCAEKDHTYKLNHHPWRCPNCGGLLYPGSGKQKADGIMLCDGCCLNMRYREPKKRKRGAKK